MPVAGATIFLRALDMSQEGQIWMLSKSMGMKEMPWFLALLTVYSIGTILMGLVFCTFAKFYVFTQSSLGLLLASTYIFAYATLFQAVFSFVVLGKIGLIIYGSITIISGIVSTVLGFLTMIPTYVIAPLGLLSPMLPYANILTSFLLLETRNGLTFDNWTDLVQENNNMVNFLSLCITFVIFLFLTFYVWPLYYTRDGKERSIFYCCKSK
jgi:hypothetical protein